MGEKLTVAEAVGRALAELGAAHVFGVVGSGNLRMTNAMIAAGVPFTPTRHEMGATTMADAFARVTDRLAVSSVHQGCGLSNALTGIGEAAKSHTPIVILSGDVARGDLNSNFKIDQDAAVTALGALPLRVNSAHSALSDTATAVYSALVGRRTVVLSVPVDIQEEFIEYDSAVLTGYRPLPEPAGPSNESVSSMVRLLAAAERPVIVAGRGGRHARAELIELADACGALLVTSAAARGLFVGDEWALDIMGGYSTDGAAELISSADVIVGFGVALNKWTARDGEMFQGAKVIQVDDHWDAIGLHRAVDLAVLGDAALVAELVAAGVRDARPAKVGYRTAETAERVVASRYWSDQPFEPRNDVGFVDPQLLTNLVDAALPLERVVVPDGGNVNCYPGAHLRVPDERGYCIPFSFQAVGMGLAAVIGATIAQLERVGVLGTGDGAFMMALSELDTAVHLGLNLVIIVYNDSAYGAEVNLFRSSGEPLDLVHYPDTDIASIARGIGCEAITVRGESDLEDLEKLLAKDRTVPLVIDAKITSDPSWLMARRHGDNAVAPTLA